MKGNIDYIHDATMQLEEFTGTPVKVQHAGKGDSVITLKDIQFTIMAKTEIRESNKGIVFSELNQLTKLSKRPVILIAKYIAKQITFELKQLNINYIDISGNTYINENQIYIFISGQKAQKISKTNQSRAFQESGIKLIFNLLRNPVNLQLSYRDLAEKTEISIGSVSNILNELEDLNYILKTKTKRVLKNHTDLLNRWIVAYNDILRPRIVKKRMSLKLDSLNNWSSLPLQDMDDVILWGGEPAAALLTGQLHPEKFTLYTNGSWQTIAKELKLTPDENGHFEILHMFWKEDNNPQHKTVPSLLVYADLISSGYERNIQIANQIISNDIQNIK